MPELVPVIKKEEIQRAVNKIARKISDDYKDNGLILIGVLKGSFIFLSDLVRCLTIPVKIDFIRVSSYADGASSSGCIKFLDNITIDIKDRDVLIVEDIIDTGLTIIHIADYLKSRGAKTVKTCTLIDKRERREAAVQIDYACHVVEEGFLVGYGLDYAENYRELAGIYHLKI
jgi:hypoxanthine phosphoribosyltransferase